MSWNSRCCSLMEEMRLQSMEEGGKVGTGSTCSWVSLDLMVSAIYFFCLLPVLRALVNRFLLL